MSQLAEAFKQMLGDPIVFSEHATGLRLRFYQQQVAAAIIDSVINRLGLTFVVIFPRQSGKNELQAQIEAYLLALLQNRPAEIVKVSPTWKPQSLNAMRRLERVLKRNIISQSVGWIKESGYIYRIKDARIYFLSAGPTTNIVGATASTLLECDEAQDILVEKWDREVAPMAASTNATRVFWGTAWTSETLLARELRLAQAAQEADGIRRVFILDADQVAAEVPAYGKYVAGEIAKHGRTNPYIRTQYFSEEIDAAGGMFPPARLALLRSLHPAAQAPLPGALYAFLVDVGGQDETAKLSPTGQPSSNPDRDRTTLTVIEVDLSTLSDPLINAPRYCAVHRLQWTGLAHTDLYGLLTGLIESWAPARVIIDATGIGEGLANFLSRSHPSLVRPFKFSQASKSDLGWRLISLIESGRLVDHAPDDGEPLQPLFFKQAAACELQILPGPGRVIRWSVPESRRDPATGELLHDDLLLSFALVGLLDDETWGTAESAVIPAVDPLSEVEF